MLDEAIEYLKMLQLQLQVFVIQNIFHQLAAMVKLLVRTKCLELLRVCTKVFMLGKGLNFAFWFEQMMSIRTGMTLPPMVVPSGLQQHMQMPQMAAMPSIGMGMGMVPMGLGMGMMDMAPQGRPVMPMQSHAGPSLNGHLASASSLVDVHGYQQPGVIDYNPYMARQHQPMQMTQVRSDSNAQLSVSC